MTRSQHAYQRLQRANPLPDTTAYEPTPEEAVAFLTAVKEESMARDNDLRDLEPMGSPPRHWLIAAATFLVVLVAGGAIGVILATRTSEPDTATSPPATSTTSPQSSSSDEVAEPAELKRLREAVNRGDPADAARIHTTEEECDRFFTTGVETCTDWYGFLVGIGTNVLSADCALPAGEAAVYCVWTLASDVHSELGINSVPWDFARLTVEGWAAVQPDGNLFTGVMGFGQLDDDFWKHVTAIVEADSGGDTSTKSNRVPATLNAEFAQVVLDAAESFERTD